MSGISTSPLYVKEGLSASDSGIYICHITNTLVTGLTLYTTDIKVIVSPPGPTPGDIDGDGQVTPGDALCVLQKFVGICPTNCGACEDVNGDVDGDGQESPADALCVLQHYVGMSSCLD